MDGPILKTFYTVACGCAWWRKNSLPKDIKGDNSRETITFSRQGVSSVI